MAYGAPGAYWAMLGPGIELRCTDYDREAAAAMITSTAGPEAEEFVRENLPPCAERRRSVCVPSDLTAGCRAVRWFMSTASKWAAGSVMRQPRSWAIRSGRYSTRTTSKFEARVFPGARLDGAGVAQDTAAVMGVCRRGCLSAPWRCCDSDGRDESCDDS